jgi:hypothetical protein
MNVNKLHKNWPRTSEQYFSSVLTCLFLNIHIILLLLGERGILYKQHGLGLDICAFYSWEFSLITGLVASIGNM